LAALAPEARSSAMAPPLRVCETQLDLTERRNFAPDLVGSIDGTYAKASYRDVTAFAALVARLQARFDVPQILR